MIYSWSKFNYGHTVTAANQTLPFKEGADAPVTALLPIGNYGLGDFAQIVQDALNEYGELDYTVTVYRSSNRLAISANGTFSLLTGTNLVTAFPLMGFNFAADQTGQTTYVGNAASGLEYYPQFRLQSYLGPDDNAEAIEPTINESSDGRVELVSFGVRRTIEMDIRFITNLPMDNAVIRNDPAGLENARAFMSYITQKKKFEFVPDVANPDTFYNVILDKTQASSNGTGYKLNERYTDISPDIYDTGVITLRVR